MMHSSWHPQVLGNSSQSKSTSIDDLNIPEDLLQRFFDLSLDLFCIANLDGYFLRLNPNFSKSLGHSDAELLSRPYLDFVHPDDHFATMEELERLKSGRDVVRFRNRYRNANGQYHMFEWTAKADRGFIYAVARDLSRQLLLEQELQTNRSRERTILNHTPALIYVKGADHRYEFVNQQFAEALHVDPETAIGKSDYSLFPLEVARQFRALDDEVICSGKTTTSDMKLPHVDGIHTYVSLRFPHFDSHGGIAAVVGVATDISDRLRAQAAEQELELAQVFQRTLYPAHAPKIQGLDIAGTAFPVSQVCGDYFDFIPLDGQRVVCALGDVSGHGYKPALQMVELRSSLRVLLSTTSSLSVVVEKLNNVLCADFREFASFVSFCIASVDLQSRQLHFIGAGQNAFIIHPGHEIDTLDSSGMVLGLSPSELYPEIGPITWEPGDTLVMFTDGFNEALNECGEQFGKHRVLECLAQHRTEPAQMIISSLYDCLNVFIGSVPVHDDMTILVIKSIA